jgi:hypothetical protein
MKKWQKKAIKEIMENFDFTRVERVMYALNWTYYDIVGIPSLDILKEKAEELLTNIAEVKTDQYGYYSDGGGFEAYHNSIDKVIKLSFTIEEREASK